MHNRPFLNLWPSIDKKIGLFLGVVFIGVFAAMVFAYLAHPWPVFTWQQLQELQPQQLPIYAFERGSLEFTLTAENYLVFERWMGNTLNPNVVALDIYFIIFCISLAALQAIVSALPRFWFYMGAMIMAFMIAVFRWDELLLFNNASPFIGIIIVGLFLAALFYFQVLRSSTSFLWRLVTFVGLWIGVVMIVYGAATANQPLRLLAVNTLPSSIVLLVIFIILVAHQIMASFVSLAVTSSRTHSLRQFLTISTIYLLNLWLTYLNRIGYLDWDYTLPSILLFAISTALTVWTIRQREPIYESILKSEILLIHFILSLGAIAVATVGYFLASSNDMAVFSIGDLVLYAHLGYGMIFLLYVAANFLTMFEKNLPVPKVLYKPTYMPYFTYRFAGIIFTLALIFYNNWQGHINRFTSAYYTSLGDIHFDLPTGTAYTYYGRAHVYAPYNQHASTALALLEGANGNYGKQKSYSIDANRYKPTEFTILNTGHLYLLSGNAYEDIQLLRKGKNLFPSSGLIRNNLGLAFTRVGMTDSAKYYFTEARTDKRARVSADMNLLALMAKTGGVVNADSVLPLLSSGLEAIRSNAFALVNRQGQVINTQIALPKDSALNLFSASLLANYLTNQTNTIDTTFINGCLYLARKPTNISYKHMILQSAGKACYAAGQVNKAVQLLQEAIFSGSNEGPNNYTLGLMAMDQEKYDVAISYFLYAINHNSAPAALANAVCLAEEGRINEAIIAWDTISHRRDTTLHDLGESMKRALAAPASWFGDLTERERLYYALYQIPLSDSLTFKRLVRQIQNEDLRAKAYLSRAKEYYRADETRLAAREYKHLQGLHLTDTRLFADIKFFELRLLAAEGRIAELDAQIQKGILFGPYHTSERVYYDGLKQWAAGDTLSAARSFDWLARNNWYFDEGIEAAALFFETDTQRSYSILSDALQVNPRSIRILKTYIPVALARGFDQYAVGALETLKGILTPEAFRKYVAENRLSGLLLQ